MKRNSDQNKIMYAVLGRYIWTSLKMPHLSGDNLIEGAKANGDGDGDGWQSRFAF